MSQPSQIAARPRAQLASLATIVGALLALAPRFATGFEGALSLGVDGGYASLMRRSSDGPTSLHGGGVGAHLTFGITDTWGVGIEGAWIWHQAYETRILTTDEEGESVSIPGSTVNGVTTGDVAVSIVYAIDVSPVTPYLAAGWVGAWTNDEIDNLHDEEGPVGRTGWEMGMRFSVGVDYHPVDLFGVGLVLHSDSFYSNASAYMAQISIFLRLSVVLQVVELGREDGTS